ncbi:cytochrome c-type biogenesis protein CcmH [Solirubrobacter sp. CPCC 204708]|uniref:Cytochrome c-type biogenesis protein n=1 Tax=Solirubrobacter deserti TaxID=2282478 RepID=A0ABT4RPD2_9ACTN|nr:cytochrome c-type biogenesis protein CcmH [Solirubrobacter deserti]MBE2319976.1 cytochrome c-type biogenesis protein CcmH [Solirubrobacter deserti]MDA0140427.1 cytochrome c-type biogenesis protein CcmH [Solirubrobacter deserti]
MKAVLVALLAVLALAAPAYAQQASLPDLEDEVMCVECGTVLSVSNSPVAQQERQFIRDQIAQGKTKDEIKAALVAEYGEDVLADPGTGGFNLTLWVVPILAALAALAGILLAVRTWRRRAPAVEAEPPPPLSAEDARRLDAELSR